MADKACIICGTRFTPSGSRRLCCTPACTTQHSRNLVRVSSAKARARKTPRRPKCVICGTTFPVKASKNTCSPECKRLLRLNHSRSYYVPTKKTCIICGGNVISRGPGKYCSPECRLIGKRRNRSSSFKAIYWSDVEKHRRKSREESRERYWRDPEKARKKAREIAREAARRNYRTKHSLQALTMEPKL